VYKEARCGKKSLKGLMTSIEEKITTKEKDEKIPQTGKTVLRKQYALVKSIDAWITDLKNGMKPYQVF